MIGNNKITLKFDELDLTRKERALLAEIEKEPGGVLDFSMRSGGTPEEITLREKLCEKLREEMNHVFVEEKDPDEELKRILRGRPKPKKRHDIDVDINL